jgi:hypothetical protein
LMALEALGTPAESVNAFLDWSSRNDAGTWTFQRHKTVQPAL